MSARRNAACFAGVDLHKDTLTACVVRGPDREVSYEKIACKCRERIRAFFSSLPRPCAVAIETVGFYRWLWTELEPLVDHLVLCDARGARALAGRRIKTDREDALNVAMLLAGVERLSADDLTMLWQHQRRLVEIEQDRAQSERRIGELMRAQEFARIRTILESAPGVALVTSATVIAEIGDFSRFPDSKAIGRYAGLAPTVSASGNSSRLGHISTTGSPDLRWLLQQAAWTAIRCDPAFKKTWLRIAQTAGKKAAAVAIARKLLVLMWTLVRKNEPYKARDPVAA